MSQKLYVGNLSYNTTEGELESLFSQAGTVESVRVMRDMATGRARGFGFVEMASSEEAQAAISSFHGTEFGGRQLTVNEARPMEARGGGGGKFGGGGGNRGGGFGGNGGGRGGRRQEPRW
ncbi:MAG: RNA-binding protein [Vicinamibacterales bacterium]